MNGNLRYSSTYGAQMVFYQAFIDDSEAKFSLPESPITEQASPRGPPETSVTPLVSDSGVLSFPIVEKSEVSKRDHKRAEQVRLANLRYQALKDKPQPAEPQPYVIDGRNGQAWINSILQYLLWRSGSSWRRLTDPKQRWDPERWYYLDGYRLLNELSRKYIPDAHCNCKYCRERTPEFQEKLRRAHEAYQQIKLQDSQRAFGVNHRPEQPESPVRKPAASVRREDLQSNYNQKRSLP